MRIILLKKSNVILCKTFSNLFGKNFSVNWYIFRLVQREW